MQQDADFINADFLYMFRASCAHHQEDKIKYFILLMMGAWLYKQQELNSYRIGSVRRKSITSAVMKIFLLQSKATDFLTCVFVNIVMFFPDCAS